MIYINLSAGGTDTVVYRINSSDGEGRVKAEDGYRSLLVEFTRGEDKLVILDVNGSPTNLAGFFDSLTNGAFPELRIYGDADRSGDLSSSELDAGFKSLYTGYGFKKAVQTMEDRHLGVMIQDRYLRIVL